MHYKIPPNNNNKTKKKTNDRDKSDSGFAKLGKGLFYYTIAALVLS